MTRRAGPTAALPFPRPSPACRRCQMEVRGTQRVSISYLIRAQTRDRKGCMPPTSTRGCHSLREPPGIRAPKFPLIQEQLWHHPLDVPCSTHVFEDATVLQHGWRAATPFWCSHNGDECTQMHCANMQCDVYGASCRLCGCVLHTFSGYQ